MVPVSQKKFFVVTLLACIALSALLGGALATGHNHQHTGPDECPVCVLLEAAQNTLKGMALASLAAFWGSLWLCLKNNAKSYKSTPVFLATPVALNVKSIT